MKKLILLLLAVILPVAINAQLLDSAPYAFKTLNHQLNAPERATQMIMGHYVTDDIAAPGNGQGLTSNSGNRRIGTILTPSELASFLGGKIVKFRVGLAESTKIGRVFVAPVSADGTIGSLKTWQCNSNAVGWNEIVLPTPYEINLNDNQSLMIGYEYQQTTSNHPISVVQVGNSYPIYAYYNLQWNNLGWQSLGNLSVQCVVEKEDYLVKISDLSADYYNQSGNDIAFTFNTRNLGIVSPIDAGACTFNVLVDGEVVNTINNPSPIGLDYLNIESAIPSTGLASGKHTLTVTVNTINGEPVAEPASVSCDFFVYERSFPRQMHLIEEFTSNTCRWCPLGARFLNTAMSLRDDIALVAIHGTLDGSSPDPYETSEANTLFNYMAAGGWPTAAFDRTTGWEDAATLANSLGYYEQYHQQYAQLLSDFFDYVAESPSYATININSTFDAATRKVTVTIDGDITSDFDVLLGADCKLSVFLTEDGLVYKQVDDNVWVYDYVHNHVFRKALGSVYGVEINKIEGGKYSNTFEYIIPSGWNTDNMDIVAFISRPLTNGASGNYGDMFVNQANKRKFGEYDEPTSIQGDVDGNSVVGMDDLAALINYLLTGDPTGIDMQGADCYIDGVVGMDDLSELITYLLTGAWSN